MKLDTGRVVKAVTIARFVTSGFDHKEKMGGLDDLGNSGKLTEIEHVFYYNNTLKSKVIIKGALGFRDHHIHDLGMAQVKINSLKLTQEKIFENHISKLTEEYGAILITNCLDNTNHESQVGTKMLEEVYQRCKDQF